MSLRKYARYRTPEKLDKTVTFRMNSEVYGQFLEYCNGLGLEVSEAIRLLIQDELKNNVSTESAPTFETQKKSLPDEQAAAASA